ncbi:hypothetical protein D9M68_199090 [compost metagenome]
MGEEAISEDDVEHGVADGHRQRIAAIGRAMRARHHAGCRLFRRQASAEREAAADALGNGHDIRADARPLMGEKLAGAADAGLNLVEDQEQAEFVAEGAQFLHEFLGRGTDAALALDRLDQDRGGLLGDRILDGRDVAERNLVEPWGLWPETFNVLLLTTGGDRRDRAAVEGALEGDDVKLLRLPLGEVVPPRRLDRAFQRFRTGIGEEDPIGKGYGGQAASKTFLTGNLVKVGKVPNLLGLRLQRLDEMRMRMAERVHGNAGSEVEIARAVFGDQPDALSSLETQRRAHVGIVKRRGCSHARLSFTPIGIGPAASCGPIKIKNAAFRRRRHYSYFALQCQQNQALQRGNEIHFPATKKSAGRACKNATPAEQVGENYEIDSA